MRSRGLPACTNCGRSPASALHLKADRLQSPVAAIMVSGALNGWNWVVRRQANFMRMASEAAGQLSGDKVLPPYVCNWGGKRTVFEF